MYVTELNTIKVRHLSISIDEIQAADDERVAAHRRQQVAPPSSTSHVLARLWMAGAGILIVAAIGLRALNVEGRVNANSGASVIQGSMSLDQISSEYFHRIESDITPNVSR